MEARKGRPVARERQVRQWWPERQEKVSKKVESLVGAAVMSSQVFAFPVPSEMVPPSLPAGRAFGLFSRRFHRQDGPPKVFLFPASGDYAHRPGAPRITYIGIAEGTWRSALWESEQHRQQALGVKHLDQPSRHGDKEYARGIDDGPSHRTG